MAASPELFSELAKALSQPSHAYRAAQEGLAIPGSAMEGYKSGADFMDTIRKRKLMQQTLGEVLGASAPTDTENIPIDQAEMLVKPVMAYSALQRAENMGSRGSSSEWSIVPGMLTKDNRPVQQNRNTGEVRPADLEVAPTTHAIPGFPDIEWATATDSNKALGKAVYEGRVRSSDMGTRDRGMAVKLGNEYARINNLPPLKSYQAEVSGKTASAFATGKPGMNALSLNTALGHSNDALQAYDAIQNTDTRLLNRPINALRAQSNDPNIIRLQTTLNALSGELATVFKGSGGTDQEIAHWQKVLSQDLTPAQARGAITQVNSLLKSRLNALDYQRQSGLSGRGEMPLLSPKGSELTASLGEDSGNPNISTGVPGQGGQDLGAWQGAQSFASEQDVPPNLAPGSRVIVGGKRAIWH
jgi:hypothetical protein